MPAGKYDHLFGGKPGAAEKARTQMRRSYGPKKGEEVWRATITKREMRAKRRR